MTQQKATLHPLRQARGKRVLALRQALRYSRRAFAETYRHLGLKASTLQSWEDGRFGGLTEAGADLLCQAFRAEGLNCHLEWLFYGKGEDPLQQLKKTAHSPQKAPGAPERTTDIEAELQSFHRRHPAGIDAIVQDDMLAPFFQRGDWVAGKRYFGRAIDQALNLPCIIQTETGKLLTRILRKEEAQVGYDLYGTEGKKESNIKLFSAAPILWLRKKECLHTSTAQLTPAEVK